MSTNYGFEPTLDGLNNIDADSMATTDIVCDTIKVNVKATMNNIQSALPTSNINVGTELSSGDILLGASAAATNVALSWGGSSNSGNLSFQGGSFTLASTGIYTQRSGPTFDMIIGDTQTSGILNIGSGVRTGAINLGTGVSSKNITLGNNTGGGTTLFNGTNVLMRAATFVGVGDSMGGGTINIGRNDAGVTTTTTNINNGTAHTGSVNIASGCVGNAPIIIGSLASSTQTATHNAITTFSKIPSCMVAPITANHLCNKTYVDAVASGGLLTSNNLWTGTNAFTNIVNLNATGTATTNIGASGTTTNILGLTYINASGTANTGIGNATGIIDIRGSNMLLNTVGTVTTNIGNALSATYLNGNTTISGLPIVPNYSTSSHDETTAATVLTQLGGTFRSTVTWLNWTTGTFNYIMNQLIPVIPGWTWPGGFVTLPKGSYSFNMGYSFEEAGVAYDITDVRVGISTSGTLTAASNDATIIASLPGGNLTAYKHYVTNITPAGSDTVVEQMSGSFYLSSSTAIYPFCRINQNIGNGINTVKFDLTITRVGL
jgi:hypothetical protein